MCKSKIQFFQRQLHLMNFFDNFIIWISIYKPHEEIRVENSILETVQWKCAGGTKYPFSPGTRTGEEIIAP